MNTRFILFLLLVFCSGFSKEIFDQNTIKISKKEKPLKPNEGYLLIHLDSSNYIERFVIKGKGGKVKFKGIEISEKESRRIGQDLHDNYRDVEY